MRVARNAGWWWPFANAVILTERPCRLLRDDRNRLHSEDGMAIKYPDGWGVYAIHGVRVPSFVVEAPGSMTVAQIREEGNAEVKRIMRERFGESRYLSESGATVIDVDSVGIESKNGSPDIIRALMKDDESRIFLVGSDGSTKRTYHMEVPSTIKTCREAHSFLCGFDESRLVAQS